MGLLARKDISGPAPDARSGTAVAAQRIYNVLFPGEIPSALRERYEQAWRILASDFPEEQHSACLRAAGRIRDLEALELAARWRGRLRPLSEQVRLMCYLAEPLPDHGSHYLAGHAAPVRAVLALAAGVARSSIKLAKGLLLLARCDGG